MYYPFSMTPCTYLIVVCVSFSIIYISSGNYFHTLIVKILSLDGLDNTITAATIDHYTNVLW